MEHNELCLFKSFIFALFQISLSLSSNLLSEAQTDKYKDLRALLQLLSSLCSKDMVKVFFLLISDWQLERDLPVSHTS
jgi:hypothetical protein